MLVKISEGTVVTELSQDGPKEEGYFLLSLFYLHYLEYHIIFKNCGLDPS